MPLPRCPPATLLLGGLDWSNVGDLGEDLVEALVVRVAARRVAQQDRLVDVKVQAQPRTPRHRVSMLHLGLLVRRRVRAALNVRSHLWSAVAASRGQAQQPAAGRLTGGDRGERPGREQRTRGRMACLLCGPGKVVM